MLPFMVGVMQLFGGLFTELANVVILAESLNKKDIVTDYIALGIIAEIDNLMIMTVRSVNFEQEKENLNLKYKKGTRSDREMITDAVNDSTMSGPEKIK